MSDAATAALPPVAASDLSSAPAAPAAPPSFMPTGLPVIPPSFDAPEAVAARAKIEELKSSKQFGKKLLSKDPASFAEWTGLHKTGFPSPLQIVTTEDVALQAAARNNEQFNKYIGWMKQLFPLTPDQENEIKGGVIRADLHQEAKEIKDRLIRDAAFRRKLLDGDIESNKKWGTLLCALSLRPVQPQ
jgi:hypothetical protein